MHPELFGEPADASQGQALHPEPFGARADVIARQALQLWRAGANPDGPGLLLRGEEYQPRTRLDFDAQVVDGVLRLARLADAVSHTLRECPEAQVKRSAAVLAARAHPVQVGLDG